MSSPEGTGTFVEATSCSPCPAGTMISSLTSVANDEISCELCPRGKSSRTGSTRCVYTTIKLPNGNGKHIAADRSGDTLGRIIDDLLQDYREGSQGNIVSKPSTAQTTAEIVEKYGLVENWDMSEVTNMHFAFWNKRTFVGDISKWDMSGVTTMQQSK